MPKQSIKAKVNRGEPVQGRGAAGTVHIENLDAWTDAPEEAGRQ